MEYFIQSYTELCLVKLRNKRAARCNNVSFLTLSSCAPKKALQSDIKPLEHHLLAKCILFVHGLENVLEEGGIGRAKSRVAVH